MVISVSVTVSVLVIILLVLIIAVVGVLIVTQRKKPTHDNEHIYESVSLYALAMLYNMTINDAYVPGTSASAIQQNMANIEKQSSTASHCSHEAVEGEEMRGSQDQSIASTHEHERDTSVCYQAGDDYEQAQCYELTGGAYDQFRGQDYEQTSDPYERVQDYEQQQASGVYDQVQSYERLQGSDQQNQVKDYEQLKASGVHDHCEWLQAHTVYEHIQGYEIVQSHYSGQSQFKETSV